MVRNFDGLVARAQEIFRGQPVYTDSKSGEQMPMSAYLAAASAVDVIEKDHKLCAAIAQEAFLRRVAIDESDGQPGAQTFDEAVHYILILGSRARDPAGQEDRSRSEESILAHAYLIDDILGACSTVPGIRLLLQREHSLSVVRLYGCKNKRNSV